MLSPPKLRESLQYSLSNMVYAFIFYIVYFMYVQRKKCRAEIMLRSLTVAQNLALITRHFLCATFYFSSLCDF